MTLVIMARWVRSTLCGKFGADGLEWINQQRAMCMLQPIGKYWKGGDEVMDGSRFLDSWSVRFLLA